MMQLGTAFKGFAIAATDGKIGTVSDLLFDDKTWKVRWLVVDTGNWLSGRKVLVHPSAIGVVNYERQEMPVSLTKAQVSDSPDILSDRPVSQQMEANLYDYYGWDPLWGRNYFGTGAISSPLSAPPYFGGMAVHAPLGADTLEADADPHLRSVAEIKGYHIEARDGAIGHVQDVLVDDIAWGIRYLIVDTRNWLPGQHVLMAPYAVREIEWSEHKIYVDVTREQVRESPPWQPTDEIREAYEQRLHTHYDWPGYGW